MQAQRLRVVVEPPVVEEEGKEDIIKIGEAVTIVAASFIN